MTLEEKHKFHAEQIDAAVAAYEIKKSEKETKFSQDKLQSAMKEIEQAITALNEKSYVKDIDEISGKIKDKLEELNSKIDKLDLS